MVVATPRVGTALAASGIELDALVHSARDPGERYTQGDLRPEPRLVVATAGIAGGTYTTADGRTGAWRADELPGPLVDTYGAGDSFAAGLTVGLGAGLDVDGALALAARAGAVCVTGAGPYGARLEAEDIETLRSVAVARGLMIPRPRVRGRGCYRSMRRCMSDDDPSRSPRAQGGA